MQLPEVEREVAFAEMAEIARVAEAVGFDSVWVGDHLLYRDEGGVRGPLDAWSVLAGLAVATERVEIGPLVTCTGFRSPGILARTAHAVSDMSGGRLVLGLGCGWNQPEFDAFGFPFDHRVARFEEAFTIVRRLLGGEEVSFQGRFFQVEGARLLPQPTRPVPLMIGSNSPRMLAAALPHVERWNTWWDDYGNTPEGFSRLNATITEAATRAGRVAAEIARSACLLVSLEEESSGRRIPEGIVPLRGEAAELAEGLSSLARAGADEAILVVNPITASSVERLGEVLALLDRSDEGRR